MNLKKYAIIAGLAIAFALCGKTEAAQAKEAICFTQAELDKALADKSVDRVSISTIQYLNVGPAYNKIEQIIDQPTCKNFNIKKGNYADKELTIRGYNANIVNNGRFKRVIVFMAKNYTEKYGNKIYVKDISKTYYDLDTADQSKTSRSVYDFECMTKYVKPYMRAASTGRLHPDHLWKTPLEELRSDTPLRITVESEHETILHLKAYREKKGTIVDNKNLKKIIFGLGQFNIKGKSEQTNIVIPDPVNSNVCNSIIMYLYKKCKVIDKSNRPIWREVKCYFEKNAEGSSVHDKTVSKYKDFDIYNDTTEVIPYHMQITDKIKEKIVIIPGDCFGVFRVK